MNKKYHTTSQQKNKEQFLVSEEKSHIFQGPIPPPESLAQYNQIVPGSAERIIKMAENEMQFRHNYENNITKSTYRIAIIGIIFAFISVIILSILVFYAINKGFETAAGWIAVGSIAAVAGVFVFFKSTPKRK